MERLQVLKTLAPLPLAVFPQPPLNLTLPAVEPEGVREVRRVVRGEGIQVGAKDKGLPKLCRYMLKLLHRVPIRWFPLWLVPLCASSKPRLTKLLRADRRRVLVAEFHSTAGTVLEKRSPAIEAPRRVVQVQAADTAAVRGATAH